MRSCTYTDLGYPIPKAQKPLSPRGVCSAKFQSMKRILAMALCLLVVGLQGCDVSPKSSKGFRLPDGDADRGREVFVKLYCHACHHVSGADLEEPLAKGPVDVELGGKVTRVQTYGELVTSIINPSHRLAEGYPTEEIAKEGESVMMNYNYLMTVQQLVDLVAFLQPHYQVVIPQYDYPLYHF